jgi:hypothetical protein
MIQGMYTVAARRRPVSWLRRSLQWAPMMLIASAYLLILIKTG